MHIVYALLFSLKSLSKRFQFHCRLLQTMKDSPSRVDQIAVKVRTANDAVQSIKQLRKEIVEIMSQLLCLAKSKNPKGMLPLCNEMVTKTRSLLNIWEPSLVEEAFAFIEKNRIIDDTSDTERPAKMSPFRNITQQLGDLDLKSPDLEDFATPMEARTSVWPTLAHNETKNVDSNRNVVAEQIPTSADIQFDLSAVSDFALKTEFASDTLADESLVMSETHFDVSGDVSSLPHILSGESASEIHPHHKMQLKKPSILLRNLSDDGRAQSLDYVLDNQLIASKHEILMNSTEFENEKARNCSIALGHNGAFLDTKVS